MHPHCPSAPSPKQLRLSLRCYIRSTRGFCSSSVSESRTGTAFTNREKDYHSHLKLMDPRRGYIQYRKAIQADIHNGRGAIALLNNILSLVSQLQAVRPNDYREEDSKIQWDKFRRFGEILSIIQECQARGPVMNGNVDLGFKKIIDETTILSDEDVSPYSYFTLSPRKCGSFANQALWERSQSLENSRGTIGGKMLKRFANLGF